MRIQPGFFVLKRALTHSPFIGRMISWAMGLPTHVFRWGVNPELYSLDPAQKKRQAVFISRKQGQVVELLRLLHSRNSDFLRRITWRGLDGLGEADYAREVREASVFLNLSSAEGLPCSLIEAMRAGTLVAGFNSVGGQEELVGAGPQQNCVLAENLDYVSLAYRLEPLLLDLIRGDLSRWDTVRQNALRFSATYTWEAEVESVVALWKDILRDLC
jgi:glycosyltransferase involved in cell wall biosynthesis